MESKEGREIESTSADGPLLTGPSLRPESAQAVSRGIQISSSQDVGPLVSYSEEIVCLPDVSNPENTVEVVSHSSQTPHTSYSEEIVCVPDVSNPKNDIEVDSHSTQTLQAGCRRVRSSSLQGKEVRKKIVRFADSLGLDLTEIKKYKQGGAPKVPVSAFADLDVTPETSSLNVVSHVASTGSIRSSFEMVSKVTKLVFLPQFHEPLSDAYFDKKLEAQKVCLEKVVIGDRYVDGVIRTLNIGFAKLVQVRYSTDGWITYVDTDAEYMPGSSNGVSDKFAFRIDIPPARLGEKLVFSVKYEVNGKEFWDNNYSEDFVIKWVVQEV